MDFLFYVFMQILTGMNWIFGIKLVFAVEDKCRDTNNISNQAINSISCEASARISFMKYKRINKLESAWNCIYSFFLFEIETS